MRTAFKEWSIVVDALERGAQSLILRKGGIHEGKGGFRMEHDQFLLFPTRFHQQREQVIPKAQLRFDQLPVSQPDHVLISSFAKVVESRRLDSFEQVQELRQFHIWREEVLRERFDWGREKSVHAIFVRVYLLAEPASIPLLPEYGGCKSWVELSRSFNTHGAKAVTTVEGVSGTGR